MSAPLQPESHLARFQLAAFRPGQREVIDAVLAGKDCLCIMPTGGGKSLCYQLPAVARPGLTLVISPLIALMKDQVDALARIDVPATCINSSLTLDEQHARLDALRAGRYSLVYVAPERFRNQRFVETIAALKPQLLAVDEAHCVSEWGHDFRPDYARIAGFRRRVGSPQTIALTATATPHVRQDVINLLELREPQTFITGFARPNLRFEVCQTAGARQKAKRLLELLAEEPGPGIIYASTRKKCSEVAEIVRQETGRKAGVYHAGLEGEERRQVQDAFMSGRLDLIVATNAFGMGIDKSDLRIVLHYNMPGSLEAYYQEAGRAGRDGRPSRCVLLFAASDRHVQEFFIDNSHPTAETIEQVYDFLRRVDADPIELTQEQIKEMARLDAGAEAVGASEQVLARAGALERLESRQNMASVLLKSDLPTLVDLLPPAAKTQRKVLRALEQIVDDRRHERVFFQPRQLVEMTELDWPAIARALREASDLDAVDYVPPFRGRAVHMLIRDRSFDDLGIDLTALDERRGAEYAKLDRMERYCRTGRCRQWEVLDYFGDPAAAACGKCDNCAAVRPRRTGGSPVRDSLPVPARTTTPNPASNPHSTTPATSSPYDWRADLKRREGEAPSEPRIVTRSESEGSTVTRSVREAGPTTPSPSLTRRVAKESPSHAAAPAPGSLAETALIALSGVARAKGRFGKQAICQMLGGSKSEKMKKFRLDQLSTFGRLGHLKQEVIADLLEELFRLRLIEQQETTAYRPVMQLSPSGWEVIRGQREIDWNESLSAKLRAALNGPAARHEPARTRVDVPDPFAALPPAERPAWYWTWRLTTDGYSLAECAAIRGIAEHEAREHIAAARSQGLPIGGHASPLSSRSNV